MAQCKLTPQEFIRDTFTPRISVMCTPVAQKLCQKNNLDFAEILQPFSKLTSDVNYKEPGGVVTILKNFKLSFLDANARPPSTALARKLLNLSVSEVSEPKMTLFEANNYQFEIPASTPWYERWRDTFLRVQYPSDHEFTKHFLACFLVVSSSENRPADAMIELAQNLNKSQNSHNTGSPLKWFGPNILKYYVILHDNFEGGDFTDTNELFECFKTSYGTSNCFLLRMNSRPPGNSDSEHLADPWSQFLNNRIDSKSYEYSPDGSPDQKRNILPETGQEADEVKILNYHPLSPEVEDNSFDSTLDASNHGKKPKKQSHGSCLSVDDIEQIKGMIHEFTQMCLLPYIEKQLITLSDSVANKKGVSKSLLTATKRWFSTNKPNVSSTTVTNLMYSIDSSELQIRRLGDLYFMFGNYTSAFQAYHAAKKDYNADQAWLYYAGALEMAALAAFMADESSRKTFDYMEDSINTYLNTCKMPQFATRATILSLECLKFKQLYGETARQLIGMTSEDSDLRSALLLEQASYCFLHSHMFRKYSFHMVLAGHRFSKAGQKRHSLRCYKQACQVYESSGWDLAGDHIHYTIGRLANNLQHFDEAVDSFSKLLTVESKQSAVQQGIFLKEYITILETKLSKDQSTGLPLLPVPELNNTFTKVLVGPVKPVATPGKIPATGIHFNNSTDFKSESRWLRLEEMLLSEESGTAPLIFKPMVNLYNASDMESNEVLAIINEPIQVSIQLNNSLQTVLILKDMHLLWSYRMDDNSQTITNLNYTGNEYVRALVNKAVIIQGNSSEDVVLSLTPLVTGNMTILGICYTLTGSSGTNESVFVRGRKILNVSSDDTCSKQINVKIVPYAPCLQMTFSDINLDFLAGEVQRISVDMQNTGSVPLKNIMLATSVPHLLSNCEMNPNYVEYTITDGENQQMKEKLAKKNHITSIRLPGNQLESGQKMSLHIWIRAPNTKGPSSIDLLAYYENVNSKSIPKYRLIRHSWNLTVQESISIDATTQISYNSNDNEDVALALKTTNLNKIHNSISTEITLLNIALYSDTWILTKDIVTPKYINLNSQESAHILCKARRKNKQLGYEYSSISLNSDQKSLAHLRTAFQDFARKSHNSLLNVFNLNVESKRRDGTLILEWEALVCDASKKRIVHGHTCIPIEVNKKERQLDRLIADTIIDLNVSTNNEENGSESAKTQVKYNLLHPAVVQHDFLKRNSCVIPITLVLHNVVENVVVVTVNTINGSPKVNNGNTSFKSSLFTTQATNNFCWLTNGKVIRTLNPLSTTSVKLSVVVANPGTFDLGSNLGVLCYIVDKDQVPILQLYEVPSSLIVLHKES